MVVVRGLAGDEGMPTGREVQALDDADLGEDIQRAEHRCPRHAEPSTAQFAEQLLGREVVAPGGDQFCERTPRRRPPVARILERADDRLGIDHARMLAVIETESQ